MPRYNGKYPEDGKLIAGTLFTSAVYEVLGRPWFASFYFDEKELPGGVSVGVVSERDNLPNENQALQKAIERGFVLSTTEGE